MEQAAAKVDVEDAVLRSWERGDSAPSLVQLRKLGEVYKRPIGVFFLPEPPKTFDAQREFRRLPGLVPGKEPPELRLALRWALFRRETARELFDLVGERPPELTAALHPRMDGEEAGSSVRALLGIAWQTQTGWRGEHDALRAWRNAVEAQGVLVFQTSGIALETLRATCIPDLPWPVILLNAKDAPYGRVFSLLHEFVHILLHAGGHQTSRMQGARSPEEEPLEVAANAYAAAALLPAKEFLEVATRYRRATDGDDETLRLLAQRVGVSPETVLRRLVTLRQASHDLYQRKRTEWANRPWPSKTAAAGAIPMEIKTLAGDGRSYTRLVMAAYDQRLISTSAASDYLGVKPCHFPNIRRELVLRNGGAEA